MCGGTISQEGARRPSGWLLLGCLAAAGAAAWLLLLLLLLGFSAPVFQSSDSHCPAVASEAQALNE
jgi:hypothetical protein